MLIDEVLPEYVASARREIVVAASADRVYTAILTADLRGSALLRALRPPRARFDRWYGGVTDGGEPPLHLANLRRFGVMVLAERPTDGVALGAMARLWSVRPDVQRVPPDYFAMSTKPGFVKIAATFEVAAVGADESRLMCEVRFSPLDAPARRRFRIGWPIGRLLVRLAQHEVLAQIRRRAVGAPALAADGG
jgi:hypothetical protein